MKYFLIILLIVFISCQKDSEQIAEESTNHLDIELRDGTKLPVFYTGSFTTDNFPLSNQVGYKNLQEIFNKAQIDSVQLFRNSNSPVSIEGTLCYPYKTVFYFDDGNLYNNLYFAKNGGLQYTVIPQGTNELANNNPEKYISLTRESQSQSYYNFTCGGNRLRFLYTIQTLTNQTQEYINSKVCNSNFYRFNHYH